MAYNAPTTRADGYVVTAAVWNSDVVANPIAINAGAIAIASQATGDVITATSASQLGRVAPAAAKTALISNGAGIAPSFQSVTVTAQAEGDVIIANSTTSLKVVTPATAGHVLTSAGAATAPVFAAQTMSLLKANSGSTTNAAAENVDTFAVTGLTAKDTLVIEWTIEAATQDTASVIFRNQTDTVAIVDVWDSGSGAFPAGREAIGTTKIRQLQSGATAVMAYGRYGIDNNVAATTQSPSTFTTNWTGSWTLAFRQGGVTAGGTFRWSWAVYKLAGQ